MTRRTSQGGQAVARLARFGLAAWFFGNLYEGVVGMPQLLVYAQPHRPRGLLTSGSPVRYFAPVAPVALGANAAALLVEWRSGEDRRRVATAAACLTGAVALSAYLIRTVNLALLTNNAPLPEPERRRLLARWHQINAARLLLLAAGSAALRPR